MNKFLTVLMFSIATSTYAADNRLKTIEENCVRAYERVDALLPFFYKFDGNLPAIKDSKVKSIKHLIAEFRDYKSTITTRRKAFNELYNDADYYQFLLQEKSASLIKELEKFKVKANPIADKNLIFSLPKVPPFGDYENPYLKIKKMIRIQNDLRDFFDELENSRMRLEQLNQQHRLNKSLDDDAQKLGFIIAFSKTAMTEVIECNLEYLEAERLSK